MSAKLKTANCRRDYWRRRLCNRPCLRGSLRAGTARTGPGAFSANRPFRGYRRLFTTPRRYSPMAGRVRATVGSRSNARWQPLPPCAGMTAPAPAGATLVLIRATLRRRLAICMLFSAPRESRRLMCWWGIIGRLGCSRLHGLLSLRRGRPGAGQLGRSSALP